MSTKSQIAWGIVIAYSSTSGGTYAPLAEVLDIDTPESDVDEIKVQRSDAPADAGGQPVTEKIPGWVENGDAVVEITYQSTIRATLDALKGVPNFWKVTYPKTVGQTSVGDTELFAGYIKKLGKETKLKDAMKMKITIAVNGAVSFAAGS